MRYYIPRRPLLRESRRMMLNEVSFEKWAQQSKNLLMRAGYADERGPNIEDLKHLAQQYDPDYSLGNSDEVGNPAYMNWIIKNIDELRQLGNKSDGICAGKGVDEWGKFYLRQFKEHGNQIANYENIRDKHPELANDLTYTKDFQKYTPLQMKRLLSPILDELQADGIMKKYGRLKRHYTADEIARMRADFESKQDELENEASLNGTEFTRREFKEPKNTPLADADYMVAHEDKKWIVYVPISHQGDPKFRGKRNQDECAEQFFGQNARKKEVESLFSKGRNSVEYVKPEWCTVAAANFNSYWQDYGGPKLKICINIPKDESGKPDFQSPYKVQCDNSKGRGYWANVRDMTGSPIEVFKIDWTDEMYDFYLKRGFITGPEDVIKKQRNRFDIENGKIVSLAGVESIVPKFKVQAGGLGRYAEIQQVGPLFIGRDHKSVKGIASPFKILNPNNGDPISDEEFVSVFNAQKVDNEIFFAATDKDGLRTLLSYDGHNIDEICHFQRVQNMSGRMSGTLYRDLSNNKSYIVTEYGLKVMDGDISMFGSTMYYKVRDDKMVEFRSIVDDSLIAQAKNPSMETLSFTNPKNGAFVMIRMVRLSDTLMLRAGQTKPEPIELFNQIIKLATINRSRDPEYSYQISKFIKQQ